MMHGVRYFKPISLETRLLIDTLTTNYHSVEAPFIVFETEDYIELKYAPTIRRATPWRSNEEKETTTNETPALSAAADGRL